LYNGPDRKEWEQPQRREDLQRKSGLPGSATIFRARRRRVTQGGFKTIDVCGRKKRGRTGKETYLLRDFVR